MRILILSPYPPYPPHGGGTMRIYQLVRGLGRHHQVTCLTFTPDAASEAALEPLRAHCRVVTVRGPARRSLATRAWATLASPQPDMALRNASPTYAAALAALLDHERFDIVQAESIEMAGYLSLVRATNQPAALVLDQFNAEFLLQRRAFLTDVRQPRRWHAAAYSLAQWLKLRAYERRAMRGCDAVLAVSEDDRQTLQELAADRLIAVVPNGVDTHVFDRATLAREGKAPLSFGAPLLLFSGTLDFRPNIDAATWFAEQVLPRVRQQHPQVQLLIAGRRPAPALRRLAAAGHAVLLGDVADMRPLIAGATAYVVPMRIGGGVRLKLLEALSLEAAVVSTRMGAEGVEGLYDGEHCLLADEPAEFAAALSRLIDQPALRHSLGSAGRMLTQRAYDWETIIPRLEQTYTTILRQKC